MDSSPKVSCLMPTKNRRRFIPGALKMFFAQDYVGDMELIVVEDGDDNVEDLIAGFSGGPKIEVTRHDSPGPEYIFGAHRFTAQYHRFEGTLGAKLNYGRDVSTGKVILQLDDDDWSAPNRVSQQVAHMQLTGKPFVAMSSLIFYREGDDFGMEYTADAWYGPGSTHCYTREYALENPRPDKTVGEDNVAVARAHEIGALSTVSGLTCLVARDHDGNCSGRRSRSQIAFLNENPPDNFRPVPLSLFKATVSV